jgi:hypothetical protein
MMVDCTFNKIVIRLVGMVGLLNLITSKLIGSNLVVCHDIQCRKGVNP